MAPEIDQKSTFPPQVPPGGPREAPGDDFWSIGGRFWSNLGSILDEFGVDFESVLISSRLRAQGNSKRAKKHIGLVNLRRFKLI